MAKKNVTIDDLAVMVQKGFNDASDKMATKIEMGKRFDAVDKRFDKIENILLKQHDDKLAELERRIRQLEEAMAV